MKNSLQKEWSQIADQLGLSIEVPFEIFLSSGKKISVDVLLKNFGGKGGMCIVCDFDKIGECTDELVNLGFGFSTLSEPDIGEEIDLESTKEMLRDWGWVGSGEKPLWY